ncbi:MAG: hypothetical protein WD470_05565 [Rhodospirillaceae bacterium]
MQQYLNLFSPTTDQVTGLAALLVVCGGLGALGALIGGPRRIGGIDIVLGWAIASFVFVLGGGVLRIGFTPLAAVLAAAAGAAVLYHLVRRRPPVAGDLLRSVVLAAPALWLAGCMAISQWDEFTQWIPNARYIYMHDGFPGAGMPETFSVFPAYPHGLAYATYLTSRIAGSLVENASAMFSIVLLASFGVMVGGVIRSAATRRDPSVRVPLGLSAVPSRQIGWVYCAIGGLAVTALNPTFVPKIVFTGYADTPTAVLVGMACILMWMTLNAFADDESGYSPRYLAICLGLTGMALISVKQVNLVLFLLIVMGGGIAALRDPALRAGALCRLLPAILAPPLAMYLLWRLHISLNEITGEFAIYEYSRWLVDEIHTIVARMLLVASKKGGYFLTMLVACGFAARAMRRTRTPLDRLSLIVATVFVGYTAFLLFAYVTSFSRGEALRAASYWRYNTHLGGACVVFGAYGLTLAWRKWVAPRMRRNFGWLAIALMLAVPLATASKIRFDARPQKLYAREVAEDFTATLPESARLAIFDLTGNGQIGIIVRYIASLRVVVVGELTAASDPTVANITRFLEAADADYIWIHVPTDAARTALGADLPPRASHLLRREGNGWRVLRTWAYPGYEDPDALPD